MESLYDISAEAQDDLFEIWRRIAGDNVELANRIDSEFHDLFASLGRMPDGYYQASGPILSALFVHDRLPTGREAYPELAVLRGKRNVKRLLKERL